MLTTTALDRLEAFVDGSIALIAAAIAGARTELTRARSRVPAIVATSPGGVRIDARAGRTESALPSTSRLVSRLRRRGLLELHRVDLDRRRVHVTMAPNGISIRAKGPARRRQLLRTLEPETPVTSSAIRAFGEMGALLRSFR